MSVTKNCLSQVLEDSRTGSDLDVTCLYKIFLESSISYVITPIRNCVKLLNLALYRVSRTIRMTYIRVRVSFVREIDFNVKKLRVINL